MVKPITRRAFLTLSLTAAGALASCALPAASSTPGSAVKYRAPVIPLAEVDGSKLPRSEDEWQALLSPLQFHVMREDGTERAFTGEYDGHKAEGVYYCSACGNPLYSSDKKYDSGTGWPSYWMPITETAVTEKDGRNWDLGIPMCAAHAVIHTWAMFFRMDRSLQACATA